MRFCVTYRGHQVDGTSGSDTPMRGGHSYVPLDDIFITAAEDMTNDIGEELVDNAEICRPNPRMFPATITSFQKFERKHERRIIRQQ